MLPSRLPPIDPNALLGFFSALMNLVAALTGSPPMPPG